GLNLTFEVREGMVKHSHDFEPGEEPALEDYLPGQRPPLEAQLIDLADEIAYNTADLDDAFSAHMFSLAEIRASVPQFLHLHEETEGHFPGAPERILFQEVLRRLIDWLVSGLVNGTAQAAAVAGVIDSDAVRRHPKRLVCFTPETQATNRELKQFLHHS